MTRIYTSLKVTTISIKPVGTKLNTIIPNNTVQSLAVTQATQTHDTKF